MKQNQVALPIVIVAAIGIAVSVSSFADNSKAEVQTIQNAQSEQEVQSENVQSEADELNSSTQTTSSAWPGPL